MNQAEERDPYGDTSKLEALRERRLERLRERMKGDVAAILNLPAGRRFLYWMVEETRLYRMCFVPGDPYASAVNEGKRLVGVELTRQVERAKPGVMSQMVREHVSEERQHKAEDAEAKS